MYIYVCVMYKAQHMAYISYLKLFILEHLLNIRQVKDLMCDYMNHIINVLIHIV